MKTTDNSNSTINTTTKNGVSTMTAIELATFRNDMLRDLIDDNRFADADERILALHGDDAVTLYPTAAILENRGFDVESMGVMLLHGCINGDAIAEIITAVDEDLMDVTGANLILGTMRPFEDGKGNVIKVEDATEMGIDLTALTTCRAGILPEAVLFTLLSNVRKGQLKADDANTGLMHYADGDVAYVA